MGMIRRIIIFVIALFVASCSATKNIANKFGEKVYVFNGFEIPSELGKPQFKDKEISSITRDEADEKIRTYADALNYCEISNHSAYDSFPFLSDVCRMLFGDYDDIGAIGTETANKKYYLLFIKANSKFYVLDVFRQFNEKTVWMDGFEGDKWSFETKEQMLDAVKNSITETGSAVYFSPADPSKGKLLQVSNKGKAVFYKYYDFDIPIDVGSPALSENDIKSVSLENEAETVNTVPDLIFFAYKRLYNNGVIPGDPNIYTERALRDLSGDYDEIGRISLTVDNETALRVCSGNYDLLYVKANDKYYPFDIIQNVVGKKEWMAGLKNTEQAGFDSLEDLSETIKKEYANFMFNRGEITDVFPCSFIILDNIDAPNGKSLERTIRLGEEVIDYFGFQIPVNLGLPDLTDDEIDRLIQDNDYDATRESIRTLADAVCYIRKAGFKEARKRIDYGSIIGADIGNLTYGPNDDDYYYSASGKELLMIREGQCTAMCTLMHYLLKDDYEELGYVRLSFTNDDGHMMLYIKSKGRYYLINPADYVQEDTKKWIWSYSEKDRASGDSLEELMNNMLDCGQVEGFNIRKLITIDYDGVCCVCEVDDYINLPDSTMGFPPEAKVQVWTENTSVTYREPKHSTSQTDVIGIAEWYASN